jgi:Flagellar biosynthesis/type III secretory pathway ATPase
MPKPCAPAGTPINPMLRAPIDHSLDVGVRAINALLTVGRGQRMGLLPVPASAKASCSA